MVNLQSETVNVTCFCFLSILIQLKWNIFLQCYGVLTITICLDFYNHVHLESDLRESCPFLLSMTSVRVQSMDILGEFIVLQGQAARTFLCQVIANKASACCCSSQNLACAVRARIFLFLCCSDFSTYVMILILFYQIIFARNKVLMKSKK